MKALVLGGGSIKGAWQAGALKAVLETSYSPDFISGISVGSLNGTFLADRAGRMASTGSVLWPAIGSQLWDFWTREINRPSDIAEKRGIVQLLWQIARKRFNGLTDTSPLREMLYRNVELSNILKCPAGLYVGLVSLNSGKIWYASRQRPDFLECVIASAAIPVTMPPVCIDEQCFIDGGLRDSAPLKAAIDAGATEILCIACHPEELDQENINSGNLMQFTDRITDIISNNNLNGDIGQARMINELCGGKNRYKGKRHIDIKVIRPASQIKVQIDKFTKRDIIDMLSSGYESAKQQLRDAA